MDTEREPWSSESLVTSEERPQIYSPIARRASEPEGAAQNDGSQLTGPPRMSDGRLKEEGHPAVANGVPILYVVLNRPYYRKSKSRLKVRRH